MEMTDKLLIERIHDLEFRVATLEQALLMLAAERVKQEEFFRQQSEWMAEAFKGKMQ